MGAKTPYALFTNDQGITFAARVLPVGARHGRNNTLLADEPTVEFYDARWADDGSPLRDGFGPLGQFVSRYGIANLLGLGKYSSEARGGLDLQGDVPAWRFDSVTMAKVREWLRERFAELVPLTPANTYTLYMDALPVTHDWATCQTVHQVGDEMDTDGTNPVVAWRVRVTEDLDADATGDQDGPQPRVWEISHADVMRAIVRIATDPTLQVRRDIVEHFRDVAMATDNEEATDAMCQPDCVGFDAVIKVATGRWNPRATG